VPQGDPLHDDGVSDEVAEELERHERRVAALLTDAGAGERVAAEICALLRTTLAAEEAALLEVGADGTLTPAPGAERSERLARTLAVYSEDGIAEWLLRDGRPRHFPDLEARSEGEGGIIALPIVIGGRPLALACVRTPNTYSSADLLEIQRAVGLAYPTVRLSGLEAQNEHLSRTIQAFVATGQAITQLANADRLAAMLLEAATRFTSSDGAALFRLDEDRARLRIEAAYPDSPTLRGKAYPLARSVTGLCVSVRHPLMVNDAALDQRFDDHFAALGIRREHVMAAPISVQGEPTGAIAVYTRDPARRYAYDQLELLATIAGQAGATLENARLYGVLKQSYSGLINSLALALEARDEYTSGHSQRVAEYSVMIARAMGCSEEDIDLVWHATILHDVGKIGVPDSVLLKRGPLDAAERALIESHPAVGFRIAGSSEFLKEARWIIRSHHERPDGRGYPEQLQGDAIPFMARIVGVADAFDAMTTARPYREPWSCSTALEVMRECSGTQFDPTVVSAFAAILGDHAFELARLLAHQPDLIPPLVAAEP